LNKTRRYRGILGRHKFVSLTDLKAGFHNFKFDEESSYRSMFTCYMGKFRWLRMPFGLS
jgi:hypothetical protein